MITGSAALNAAIATLGSPLAIASSTLRTELRSSVRRALLISVLRAILRVALRAELVLAMQPLVDDWGSRRKTPRKPPFFGKICSSDKGRCHGEAYSKAPRSRQRPQQALLRDPFGSHRVMAAEHHGAIGRRKRGQWRIDPPKRRVAMDMAEQGLNP